LVLPSSIFSTLTQWPMNWPVGSAAAVTASMPPTPELLPSPRTTADHTSSPMAPPASLCSEMR